MTLQISTLFILSCFQYHIITSHTLYGHTNKTTLQTFMKCLKDPSYSTRKTTKDLHHFVQHLQSHTGIHSTLLVQENKNKELHIQPFYVLYRTAVKL